MEEPPNSPALSRSGWKRLILFLYLAALLVSHLVSVLETDNRPRSDQESIVLEELDGATKTGGRIRFAFVDSGNESENQPTLIVLHGSPAASPFMMPLHRSLSRSSAVRVITPDLPGFGGSSRSIADYSVAAHARYLIQAMDALRIKKAHFLAYSMGGGVALELYRLAPERVESIAMVSAIGVQELELTGNYHLNHAIHGLQLAGLWFISEAIPHFGWMDDALLGVSYARNFFDTDQRPLRGILSSYEAPMEIIHGTEDFLVLFEVAKEHHRLVPQSTLRSIEGGGHGLVIQQPDSVAHLVLDFVKRVGSNTAPRKRDATPARITAAAATLAGIEIPPASGFALVVFFILIVGATLVSEDLACIGAGLMAAKGTLTFLAATSAAFTGIFLGDVLLYALGYCVGGSVIRRPPIKWMLSEDKLNRGAAWFRQRGMKAVLICRFVPGSRLPTFVAAGVLKAPFWRFLLFFLLASLIWTPLLVGLSSILGSKMLDYYELYQGYALWSLLGFILLLYISVHVLAPALTHRGRRINRSRWMRLTRWEFWPAPIFYFPVLLYVFRLAIQFRSLTVFTAANPSMPHGGFVGESKTEILSQLQKAKADIARFKRLGETRGRSAEMLQFMRDHDLSFPIVLKPDIGERGDGVSILRSTAEAEDYFAENRRAILVQEFVPGVEFGVFYYRNPGAPNGRIFSVTEKIMISVSGNGTDTLENLILDDDRANCLAPLHMRVHVDRLDTVPPQGERVELVSVGTHCRGSLFLDGMDHVTAELSTRFDQISLALDGINFGRFDVRSPDLESFKSGVFTVIELNGVTSEATHIYDPSNTLFQAYRDLFLQWSLAFKIGNQNKKLGHKPSRLRDLIGLVIEHKLTR